MDCFDCSDESVDLCVWSTTTVSTSTAQHHAQTYTALVLLWKATIKPCNWHERECKRKKAKEKQWKQSICCGARAATILSHVSGRTVKERKASNSLKSALSAGAQRERKHELVKTTWDPPTLDGAGFCTLSAAPTCRFHISAAPTLERGHAINIKAGVWRDFRLAQGHWSSLTSCKFDKTFLRNAWARSKPRIGYLQRQGCLAAHELEEFTHGFGIWLEVGSVQVTVTWTLLERSQSWHQVRQIAKDL